MKSRVSSLFRAKCAGALALLCLVPRVAAGGAGGESRASGSERRFALVLPDGQPPALELTVPVEGASVVLELELHSLRAPGAFVRVVGEGGVREDLEPPPVTTYRGSVRGDPASTVFASLLPAGLSATVVLGSGERYQVEPERSLEGARRLHVVRPAPPPEPFACGSDGLSAVNTGAGNELFTGGAGASCLTRAGIALEADHPFYLVHGSVPATIAALDAFMNEVDFAFARDVQITHAITAYVVRTAPYYAPTSGGHLLDLFAEEWRTNQTDVPRDIAHLVMGPYRPEFGNLGGIAFIGVVCDPGWHYGLSMDHASVILHELGHNWGAGHCHEGCDVMCGLCTAGFGPSTRAVIQAFRDSRGCLEPAGPYPVPVPPYLLPQQVTLRKDELEAREPLVFDVLAGAEDGNCEPLQLGPWQRVSNGGNPIVRPRMTAPGAPARLEYHADEPFVGQDSFWYSVSDGTMGLYSKATARLLPLQVAVHLPFDERTGTSAADASGHGYECVLLGAPGWNEGRFGGAVELDGSDDSVVLPRLDLRSNQVTLTTWLYREAGQPAWAGLVYTRAGSSVAGLHFGPGPFAGATRLRYTWNADPATFQWAAPGLTVPLQTWCFAALVVRPDEATLYLHDGTELRSATNRVPHAIEEFDGETHIGQDPYPGRRFRGRMDDVRVYPYALHADEIAALASGAGPADAPFPRDGGRLVDEQGALSWVPAHGVSDHALYLGTSWSAVRDATTSSPEFRGFFDPARFVPGPLAAGETYYWRVDGAPFLEPGHVWQFQRRRSHRWTLDEKQGRIAFDAEGKGNGDYWGNPRLYEPGATPALGHSVRFDGKSFVQASPLMDIDDFRDIDHLTLTAWVRRDGHQLAYTGLVGTSSVSLHMGPDDELRYNWVTAGWPLDWPSGLVLPDGEWAFVALVVEPTRARIHLGRDGVLASAEYHPYTGHPPVPSYSCYIGWGGFRGWLDDVRFCDEALTPAQIEELYVQSR